MPDRDTDPVPDDVTDVLLWRLATTVASDHHPDPVNTAGTSASCVHPTCAGAPWPCPPHRHAQQALAVARRPMIAVGRATVATPAATVDRPLWSAVPAPTRTGLVDLDPAESAVLRQLHRHSGATAEQVSAALRLRPDIVDAALAYLHLVGLARYDTPDPATAP